MTPKLIIAILIAATLQAQPPQRVEGFSAIVHNPAASARATKPQDYRGPSSGFMTKPWWTTDKESRLKWKTAVVPEKRATVFAFTAASSVVPAEFTRGPR